MIYQWFITTFGKQHATYLKCLCLKVFGAKNGWLDFQIWFQFRGPWLLRRFWGIANCPYINLLCLRSCCFFHFLSSWFVSLIFVLCFGTFFTDLSYEEHNEVKLLACLSKLLYLTWWTMLVRLMPTFSGRPIFRAKKCSLVEIFAGLMSLGLELIFASFLMDGWSRFANCRKVHIFLRSWIEWAVLNSGVSPLFEKACYELGPVISIKNHMKTWRTWRLDIQLWMTWAVLKKNFIKHVQGWYVLAGFPPKALTGTGSFAASAWRAQKAHCGPRADGIGFGNRFLLFFFHTEVRIDTVVRALANGRTMWNGCDAFFLV